MQKCLKRTVIEAQCCSVLCALGDRKSFFISFIRQKYFPLWNCNLKATVRLQGYVSWAILNYRIFKAELSPQVMADYKFGYKEVVEWNQYGFDRVEILHYAKRLNMDPLCVLNTLQDPS